MVLLFDVFNVEFFKGDPLHSYDQTDNTLYDLVIPCFLKLTGSISYRITFDHDAYSPTFAYPNYRFSNTTFRFGVFNLLIYPSSTISSLDFSHSLENMISFNQRNFTYTRMTDGSILSDKIYIGD